MINLVIFCSKKPKRPAGYWEGSLATPIYEQGRKNGYSAKELAEIVFSDPENKFRCRTQPLRLRSRKCFLIDLGYLPIEDLHADKNGAYKHQATRSKPCCVEMVADCEIDYFQIMDYRKIDLINNTYYQVQQNRICESCEDLKTIVLCFEG